MNTQHFKVTNHVRTFSIAAGLALVCAANADLRMKATVTSTGGDPTLVGNPRAGNYEVDFRAGQARIVGPSGAVMLFDFSSSQVAILDATKKTYTLQTIAKTLSPTSGHAIMANLNSDTSATKQTLFGATATRYSITSQLNDILAGAPNLGSGSISGSAWILDGSEVSKVVGSVAPLVWIGAPRSVVASITQTLDQQVGIPAYLSLNWSNGPGGVKTVTMTVSNVETVTFDDATFAIPPGYTQVVKATGR